MKAKTIFIIVLTALLTVFLTVNSEPVDFDFLIGEPVPVSKLLVIGTCVLIGFIIGFIVGKPKKTVSSYDNDIEKGYQPSATRGNELSDEDKDYIN